MTRRKREAVEPFGPESGAAAYMTALEPQPDPMDSPAFRWRQPGWTPLLEAYWQANRRASRRVPRGRPHGSGLVPPRDRTELLELYAAYANAIGRDPSRAEFAESLSISIDTLRTRIHDFETGWPPRK